MIWLYLPLESLADLKEDGIDLRYLFLVSLGISGLVQNLHGFFPEHIYLALTCSNHRLNVLLFDLINISHSMISMLAHCASETDTYLTISAVPFDVLARMLRARFVTTTLASCLHLHSLIHNFEL